ncbi:MAG: hypothetical protein CXX80_07825 [Methanobacteriota archaeon]|nr:MAG: hypothetical protein CXX80_07825 [Euryarchaeota archaeon]
MLNSSSIFLSGNTTLSLIESRRWRKSLMKFSRSPIWLMIPLCSERIFLVSTMTPRIAWAILICR